MKDAAASFFSVTIGAVNRGADVLRKTLIT